MCCLLYSPGVLSWLYLAGEYELQDWHGERYHSHADDSPGCNDGGCGAFVPVVCFEDYDVGGWRQHSENKKYLWVRQ